MYPSDSGPKLKIKSKILKLDLNLFPNTCEYSLKL